jgi:hypothetical protein
MALVNDYETVVPAALVESTQRHYVDWGAILAGVAVSSGLFSIFAAFTSAIGLALAPSASDSRVAGLTLLAATALWALWIQLSSTMAGAYITGRMRHRIGDAKQHEVELRDGAHGLVMWAVSVIISAMFAGWLAMTAGSTLSRMDVDAAYFTDRLTRAEDNLISAVTTEVEQAKIAALLARVAAVPNDDDQTYLSAQVAKIAGISEPAAATRVKATIAEMAAVADKTRRFGILVAFFTAASLLVGAVSAWWAAGKGGEHRDQGIDHSHLTRFR